MMVERLPFFIVLFVAYVLQGITGFAGNVISMPAGIFILGIGDSAAILNATSILACGIIAISSWRKIDFRELAKLAISMTILLFVGIWLDTVLSLPVLLAIYGAFVLAVGIWNLVSRKEHVFPEWALWLIIIVAGLIQGMFVSGGALLVLYAVQKFKDKGTFRATLASLWVILNIIYVVFAAVRGAYTSTNLITLAICIPIAILATFIGMKLQSRFSQKAFLKFVFILLVAIGCILIWRSVVTFLI